MRPCGVMLALALACGMGSVAAAQARKAQPAKRPPLAGLPTVKASPDIICPTILGEGVISKRTYCDVMTGRDPAGGILIPLPPHRGPVTLTFDLHNRHTYSEEQVQANRAYARYTAMIGALTMDNTLISRAAIQSEFRRASDLVERISGGAGPGGLKAVAPTGTEHVTIVVPEVEEQVSLLGEKLIVERADGVVTYSAAGRPIAGVSNIQIEFRAAPAKKPAPARRP